MEPIILHGDMSLIRFGGVVSVEIIQPGNMLRPWRYDYTLKDFFDVGLQFMAAHLSGSRIHLKTSSSKIRVIAKNLSNTSICDYDCYVNKQFVATKISTGKNVINAHGVEYNGKEMMRERYRVSQLTMADLVDEDFHTIEFDLSPYISEGSNHMNDVEIWLPHTNSIYLKDIFINNHSKIQKPLKDGRPKFITHGSSITHAIAGDATTSVRGRGTGGSPSKSWPGTCARVCDFNLTNLGFGGQCHMDNSVARTIRDLPADFIALKLGINTHNMATFGIRGFSQAAIGFLRTIRDGHPNTPIVVLSPIYSTWREKLSANVVTLAMEPERNEKLKMFLSLEQMRRHLKRVIEILQRNGDTNLYYRSGLDMFNIDDFNAGLMPDGLHPNADGYQMMGRRFAAMEFGPSGRLKKNHLTEEKLAMIKNSLGGLKSNETSGL